MSMIPTEDGDKNPKTNAADTKPAKPTPAKPAPAPAKRADEEREEGVSPLFFGEQTSDFGYAKNTFTGSQNGKNFLSTPGSELQGTNGNAGFGFINTRAHSETLFKLGVQYQKIENKFNDGDATVSQYQSTGGRTPDGAPTGNIASQSVTGHAADNYLPLSNLRLLGGNLQVEHHTAGLIMGARAGAGALTSQIGTVAFRNAVTAANGAIKAADIPGDQSRKEFAGTGGLTFGLDQGHILPGLKFDADAIKSKAVLATNIGLTAFKDIPLGDSGVAISLQGGVNRRNIDIKYDGPAASSEVHTKGGYSLGGAVGVKFGFR